MPNETPNSDLQDRCKKLEAFGLSFERCAPSTDETSDDPGPPMDVDEIDGPMPQRILPSAKWKNQKGDKKPRKMTPQEEVDYVEYLSHEVDGLFEIAQRNLELLKQRGESLDTLDARSRRLLTYAGAFKQEASDVRDEYAIQAGAQDRQCTRYLVGVGAVLVALVLICALIFAATKNLKEAPANKLLEPILGATHFVARCIG